MRIKCHKKHNEEKSSYICEYGYLHDYSKMKVKDFEKDRTNKTYGSVEEMKEDMEK